MANRSHIILKIHWNEPGYEYIDLIPYEWFRHDVDDEDKCYSITNPRGRRVTQARCKISVSGSQATLYYGGSNKHYNERRRISIGTTRVTFHEKSRNGVHKVEWEDEKNLIEFFIYFIKNIPSIFHRKPMGNFWLEIDEKDGKRQREPRRLEQYPEQAFLYTGRIKRWLVVVLAMVVLLIVAVTV